MSLYLLFFSPFLEIESISVEGNEDIPASEISGQIEKSLDGKYFRYFVQEKLLFIRTGDIEKALASSGKLLELEYQSEKNSRIPSQFGWLREKLCWSGAAAAFAISRTATGLLFGGMSGSGEEAGKQNFLAIVDDSARPVEIGKRRLIRTYLENLSNFDVFFEIRFQSGRIGNFHTPGMASQEINLRNIEKGGFSK